MGVTKLFIPLTFAVLIALLINRVKPTHKVIVDREYTGYEKFIGEKITDYLNSKTAGGVEYVSYKDLGNIYEITVSYEGSNLPVYITKDGEYFIQVAIPTNNSP